MTGLDTGSYGGRMVTAEVVTPAVDAPAAGELRWVADQLYDLASELEDMIVVRKLLEGRPARRVGLRVENLRDTVISLYDVAKGLEGSGWAEQREATPRQEDDPPGIAPP